MEGKIHRKRTANNLRKSIRNSLRSSKSSIGRSDVLPRQKSSTSLIDLPAVGGSSPNLLRDERPTKADVVASKLTEVDVVASRLTEVDVVASRLTEVDVVASRLTEVEVVGFRPAEERVAEPEIEIEMVTVHYSADSA